MADVFVSYKREDRARVEPLVDALAAEGVSVFWDVGLEGGAAWRHSLQTALEGARCVIVVWTEPAVGPAGEFVQDEASWAKVRGVYLPVLFDRVMPPLGFGQVHTLRLLGWTGDRQDPGFKELLSAARAMIAAGSAPADRPAGPDPERSRRSEKPRVAVLKFRHPPGDAEQAYFAESVAEDVIGGLSRSRLMRVLPAQSSLTYEARDLTAGRICAALGADYIVQGQVRSTSQNLRVAVHLTHGLADKVVWSARYDRPVNDLLGAQDDVTAAIVAALEPALLAHEEQQAFRATDETLGAWELFLRGRWYFWRGRRNDAAIARECLEKALGLNPGDAPTVSLLAYCQLHDVWMGIERNPMGAIAEAHRLALEAVGLDGQDALAHHTLGVVLSMMGRLNEDLAEQERALELNPCLASAAGERARLFAFAGRTEEALAEADRAIGLSPNDPNVWLWYRAKAHACFVDGRYDEAKAHAMNASARRPDYYFLHELLAACAMAAGDREQARAALAEAQRRMPHHSLAALKATHPFTHPEHLDRYVAALQEAGWGARIDHENGLSTGTGI